ncbi:PepSY-like domain-containing protein [Parapedobacter sp. GCM10030251]|uniref:PepSY-like domain-containing protein n=1 Tax=Parapedobacter sp. GCM10030251 TaxID=3273419 RepID=UPI00361570E8
MKKLVIGFTVVLLLTSFSAMAQNAPRGVPAVVLNAFQQQFPKARQAEWERRNDGTFEVEFNVGLVGRDQKAFISPDGKVLKHEEELSSSSLPEDVKKQIKAEFAGYRVDEVKKITEGGKVVYAVDLESRSGDLKVHFDPAGKILKERMD